MVDIFVQADFANPKAHLPPKGKNFKKRLIH